MKHVKIDGKWRITDDNDKILVDSKKVPLDMGGHETEAESIYHAEYFNVKEPKKRSKK